MSTTDLINSRKWRCAKCETYLGMDVEISTNRDQDVEMLHFRCHGEFGRGQA